MRNTMDYWTHKIAVVTGASSGIGAAIALELARHGLQVVALALNKEQLDEITLQASTFSGAIHAIECDVSQIESIEAAFQEINKTFGRVHVLINNAGRTLKGKVLNPSVQHLDYVDTINTNFSGVVICTREATKLIEKHDDLAYIININSVYGHMSPTSASTVNLYMATKHAITAHTADVRFGFSDNKRVRVTVSI